MAPIGKHDPRICACFKCNDPCGPAMANDALCGTCRAARDAGEPCHPEAVL